MTLTEIFVRPWARFLLGFLLGFLVMSVFLEFTRPKPSPPPAVERTCCPTCTEKLDTLLRNQHTLYRAITNHDHYLREWTRPVEF